MVTAPRAVSKTVRNRFSPEERALAEAFGAITDARLARNDDVEEDVGDAEEEDDEDDEEEGADEEDADGGRGGVNGEEILIGGE